MKRKLYFITSISLEKQYKYVYIITQSKENAKELFEKEFLDFKILSIRALYPSKKNSEKIIMYIKKSIAKNKT